MLGSPDNVLLMGSPYPVANADAIVFLSLKLALDLL